MGQLDAADHIADGVDSGHIGFIVFIDKNAAPVHGGNVLQPFEKSLGQGSSAHGHQYLLRGSFLGLSLFFIGADQGSLSVFIHLLPDALEHGGGMDVHILLFQNHFQVLAKFLVQGGQDPVQGLDHCYPGAQGCVQAGKLHAYDASADDGQRLQRFPVVQDEITVHDSRKIHARQGQLHRRRAGGDEQSGSLDHFLANGHGLHVTGAEDPGRPFKQSHLGFFELGTDTIGQGAHCLIFIILQGIHIHPDVGSNHTDGGSLPGIFIDFGCMKHGLGGDAAPAQTGSANGLLLADSYLHALSGGRKSRHIAAGTGADDNQIKILYIHFTLIPRLAE